MRSLRLMMILLTLLLTVVLPNCRSQSNAAAAHELLDAYLKNQMSLANAKDGAAKMKASLDSMEVKAKGLKGELPEEFFNRYMRLIAATRLVIESSETSGKKQEITNYIRSVTGSAPSPGQMLPIVAAFAFSTEVVKLGMLVDGETDFEKAKKKQADRVR